MNRFVVPLIAFAALAIVLGVGVKRSPEKGILQSQLIGRTAPAFELPSLTDADKKVSTRDYKGRWYVVNVWGTWCVECRVEHDTLLEAQRSAVAPIIGLNWKDDDSQALAWLAQLGNPYEAVAVDHEGRVAIDWGVYGAPETFLVNPQGIVVHRHVGPLSPEVWQRDFVSRITSSSSPSS